MIGDRSFAPSTRGLLLAGLTVMLLAATQAPPAARAAQAVSVNYVVMAHPDDEYEAWSLIRRSPDHYEVFLFATQGEQTAFCQTPSEGAPVAGPYGYQGPASPVGEPDLGEVNPRSPHSSWVGRWTSECKDARMKAALAYLEDKAVEDSSLPAGFTYRDTYSFGGNTAAGIPPRRDDGGATVESREAVVFDAANGRGKVVFFDLGDGDVTKEEVGWAITSVIGNAALLGVPGGTQSSAVANFDNAGAFPDCSAYNHPDHQAVHEALWEYALVGGPQHGRTCTSNPDALFINYVSEAEHRENFRIIGSTRVGPFQRRYGWLASDYWSEQDWWCANCVFSREQSFWTRYG